MRPPSGDSPRAEGLELHQRPRVVVERMLNAERMPSRHLTSDETASIGQHAIKDGVFGAALIAANAGAAVFMANFYSASFRGALGISGKVALVVIPSFFVFGVRSHLVVAHATANPFKYMKAEGRSD